MVVVVLLPARPLAEAAGDEPPVRIALTVATSPTSAARTSAAALAAIAVAEGRAAADAVACGGAPDPEEEEAEELEPVADDADDAAVDDDAGAAEFVSTLEPEADKVWLGERS